MQYLRKCWPTARSRLPLLLITKEGKDMIAGGVLSNIIHQLSIQLLLSKCNQTNGGVAMMVLGVYYLLL